MTAEVAVNSETSGLPATRWLQLISGIVCLALVANLQYGWTLFVNPINQAHGWSITSVQLGFSICIALQTWATPFEGWIVDTLSWRAIFFINLPIALVALAIAFGHVPERRDRSEDSTIDWLGGFLVTAGLLAMAYGLTATSERGWTHPWWPGRYL